MSSFMQNNCAVLNTRSLNLENRVSIFFYFYWLSFFLSSWTIEKFCLPKEGFVSKDYSPLQSFS